MSFRLENDVKVRQLIGVVKDFAYSMFGLMVMHAVTQFVMYPALTRELGAEQFGIVLTLISFISVMSSTFGTAANYSRMVNFQKGKNVSGDYNVFLAGVLILALLVSVAGAVFVGVTGPVHILLYFILMAVTILRFYGDVEFRMNVNYKRFCLYYILIALGYLAGIFVFKLTGIWSLALIPGELAAILYVTCIGQIFKSPLLGRSEHIMDNFNSFLLLSGTEIIGNLVFNGDRLILKIFVGGSAVTLFYVASLMGKLVSLVLVPLNGVLIGHLSRYRGNFKFKTLVELCGIGIIVSVLLSGILTFISHIFVKLLYPDIYNMAVRYFYVANLGQILYFISNTLTVILLRFSKEKYQLYINVSYMVVFLCMVIPATAIYGIWGLAWTLVAANFMRIILVLIIGKAGLKVCLY